MPYEQTALWKQIVTEISDETLDSWISSNERSLPIMKDLASRGDPHSEIYTAIAIGESDLVLYREEKARRLAQKR